MERKLERNGKGGKWQGTGRGRNREKREALLQNNSLFRMLIYTAGILKLHIYTGADRNSD